MSIKQIALNLKIIYNVFMMCINPFISWHKIKGGIVAFNCKTKEFYTLNEIAAKVFLAFAKEKNYTAIKKTLLKTYNVSEQEVETDLKQLIGNFIKKGIIILPK